MKYGFFLVIIFTLIGFRSIGQSSDANYYYSNFEFKKASEIWEKLGENSKLSQQINDNLLWCYLFTEQPEKGLKLIEQLRLESKEGYLASFAAQYAFQLGKFDLALQESKLSKDAGRSDLPPLFDANCQFSIKEMQKTEGRVENSDLNSVRAELIYKCGDQFIFLKEEGLDSVLNETANTTVFEEVFFLRPYVVVDGKLNSWNALGDENRFWSMTSIQIDQERKMAFFSIMKPLEGSREVSRPKMYQADFNGYNEPLTKIKALETDLDLNSCSNGQVALSTDGKFMVLAVNADTAMSTNLLLLKRENDRWLKNRFLVELNTQGEDVFPSFIGDSIFRYSSDGLPGYGNLDCYQVSFNNGKFSDPVFFPKPINSHADDFLVYGNFNDTLIFNSNRGKSIGDDDVFNFFPTIKKKEEEIVSLKRDTTTQLSVPKIVTFAAVKVYFDFNKSTNATVNLDVKSIKEILDSNPDQMVVVTGNTDLRGSNEYNDNLAMERAKFVKNELVKSGIPENRIRLISEGEKISTLKNHISENQFKLDRFVLVELKN